MKKLSHRAFEMRQKCQLWIEQQFDGQYAIMMKTDAVGNSVPNVLAAHDSLMHATVNMNAILTLMGPNIVEGSMVDVSQFNHRGKK